MWPANKNIFKYHASISLEAFQKTKPIQKSRKDFSEHFRKIMQTI